MQVEGSVAVGPGRPPFHLRVSDGRRPSRQVGDELRQAAEVGAWPDGDEPGVANRQERRHQNLPRHGLATGQIEGQCASGREPDHGHGPSRRGELVEGRLGCCRPVGPLRGRHGRARALVAGQHGRRDDQFRVLERCDQRPELVGPAAQAVQDQAGGRSLRAGRDDHRSIGLRSLVFHCLQGCLPQLRACAMIKGCLRFHRLITRRIVRP